MSFTKIDTNNKWSKQNLLEADFNGVGEITKVAYVSDVSSGITKNGDFFMSLYLKTEDGLTISSKIFNHKFLLTNAFAIQSFKGKFVKVTGIPGVFRNMYSFIINQLEEVPIQKVEHLEHFLKTSENLENDFRELSGLLNDLIPENFKIRSYQSINNGKVGGYVTFCNCWVKQCLAMSYLLDESQVSEMKEVLLIVINKYEQYLSRLNELDFVTSIEKRQILPRISDDKNLTHKDILVDDVLGALLELGEPNHLISHMIVKSFNLLKDTEELKSQWTSMLPGGVLKLKDDVLRKY